MHNKQKAGIKTKAIGAIFLSAMAAFTQAADNNVDNAKKSPSSSGFFRINFDGGENANSFAFGDLLGKYQWGNCTTTGIIDIVNPDQSSIGGAKDFRLHTAQIDCKTKAGTLSAGLLGPANHFLTGQDFVNGLPGAIFSNAFVASGGQAGVEYNQYIIPGLSVHVRLATRDQNLSRFGNPDGPGFESLITQYGFEFDGKNQSALWNFKYHNTHFGKGPAGQDRDEIYYGATVIFPNKQTKLIGEHRKASDAGNPGSADTVVMLQQFTAIDHNLSLISAAGFIDGQPAVELNLQGKLEKNWTVQIGVGYQEKAGETLRLGFRHNF